MSEPERLLRILLRQLISDQSEGEWDDAMIERDVDKFAVALKPLLISPSRPQPEPVTAQPQPDVGRLVEALERIAAAADRRCPDLERPR